MANCFPDNLSQMPWNPSALYPGSSCLLCWKWLLPKPWVLWGGSRQLGHWGWETRPKTFIWAPRRLTAALRRLPAGKAFLCLKDVLVLLLVPPSSWLIIALKNLFSFPNLKFIFEFRIYGLRRLCWKSLFICSLDWLDLPGHWDMLTLALGLWHDILATGHTPLWSSGDRSLTLGLYHWKSHLCLVALALSLFRSGSLSGPRALSVTLVLGQPWWVTLFSQTHPLLIRAQEKSVPHLESGNNLSVKKLGD